MAKEETSPSSKKCPICGNFLRKGDYFCRTCGWIHERDEAKEDALSYENGISPRQYKELLSSIKEKIPDFVYEKDAPSFEEMKNEFMKNSGIEFNRGVAFYGLPCPVCGEEMIRYYYDICSVCGWELDEVQTDDPDFWGGANTLSLNDSKKAFIAFREKDPSYRWENNSDLLYEKGEEMVPFYEARDREMGIQEDSPLAPKPDDE